MTVLPALFHAEARTYMHARRTCGHTLVTFTPAQIHRSPSQSEARARIVEEVTAQMMYEVAVDSYAAAAAEAAEEGAEKHVRLDLGGKKRIVATNTCSNCGEFTATAAEFDGMCW